MSGHDVGWRIRVCLPFVAALFAVSGCSGDDGLPRQAVAGTVLLDGQRLAKGSILFLPVKRPAKSDNTTASGDLIKNGRFSLTGRKGLTRGMYKIMIFSETKHHENPAIDVWTSADEMVPARFNAQTELELDFKEGTKSVKIEIESK